MTSFSPNSCSCTVLETIERGSYTIPSPTDPNYYFDRVTHHTQEVLADRLHWLQCHARASVLPKENTEITDKDI